MRSILSSLAGAIANRSPVPLVRRGDSAGAPSIWSGPNDSTRMMMAYGEVGTVFAIVNRIASSASAAQWHLYKKAKSGLDEDRTEVTSHPALDLLRKPNKFMTTQEMIEIGQQHIDLTGEADLVISKFGKIPYELWPVRPDKIDPVPDPYEFIAGYVYHGPDGEKVPLGVNDVIQLRMPNPLDPYTGLGPVQSILTDIDSSKYSAEWNKNFFMNSAEPGGVIEIDHRMGDDEYREMRERWGEQHKGVANAHRVALLEGGSKWVDRKISQRDMEFTSLSNLSRDKILEAFGFPKSMLGIVEDVNRANAESSEYVYAKWIIVPRLDRWKAAFNNDLLAQFAGGDQLEFDYDSPVPENSDQENAALTAKWGAVAQAVPLGFDAPQLLEALGLPAIDFEKPEPPPVLMPGTAPGEKPKEITPAKKDEPNAQAITWREAVEIATATFLEIEAKRDALADREIEAAQKWETVVHEDDSTCDPCKAQKGKTYKNREDAYDDYPKGAGYKDCVGAEFGNTCRCTVRKRKASS